MAVKKKNTHLIIGGIVIVGAIIALSVLQLGEDVVYFYTPEEASLKAATLQGKTIKVGGMVKVGSVNWQAENLDLNFVISNLKGTEIAIAHKGTPPDLFKEGSGVVVSGLISDDGKSIKSDRLMVKHSEEYRAPTDDANMDHMLLKQSLFKE